MKLKKIDKIAKKLGLSKDEIIPYGYYKAKIDISRPLKKRDSKLVLVTAITPTKAGEGKTTTSIALADGLASLNKSVCLALREPSLGPVFGMKGGPTGGGKVTVEPQQDINLHFTGDMHALTSSINLISACIDNHIFQGNELGIDENNIVWKRAMDMNDRALREITVAQGKKNGVERKDGFVITVASEMMAIMCLASSKEDFKKRLGEIVVAYTYEGKKVTVKDLKITNAIMMLMEDALKPNLVQTSANTPCIIHGGPFANIAHGCNSIIATKLALNLADIVITEAGFGADLGAEKFLDIKCQEANLTPSLVVMVATIRALKLHGGEDENNLDNENLEALRLGLVNLERHVENIKKFGLDFVININRFASDSLNEIDLLEDWCIKKGYPFALNEAFKKGGKKGAYDIATLVLDRLERNNSSYHPLYSLDQRIEDKILTISQKIYGARDVVYSDLAKEKLELIHANNLDNFYVCMAKTPLSFSDNPKIKGAPTDFDIHVKDINIAYGSHFIIPITGSIMTMPGLPKVPQAVKMEEE